VLLGLGATFFAVSLARFFAWAYRSIERYRDDLDVPFPSPPRGNG
jgi:hypothetical protein